MARRSFSSAALVPPMLARGRERTPLYSRFPARARLLALAGLAVCATTVPAADAAAPTTGATEAAKPPVATTAKVKAKSTRHVRAGGSARVRGKVAPAKTGRRVHLQVRTRKRWKTVKRGVTRAGGVFRMKWKAPRAGNFRLRVKFRGDTTASAAAARSWRVSAYRASHASWYGPGLYGNALGCGGTLSAGTVGVAHKTLPCGTKVTFRYRGRSVTAPVVDRGPYVGGREWDLTAGLKQKLGFGSTGTVLTTK